VIDFKLAQVDEDAELRGLLRTAIQPTWVDMTLEREPSFFAGSGQFGEEYPVLARQRESRQVVGMCTCTLQNLYVDGQPQRVNYMGGLRVGPAWRHRIGILRQGFASITRLVPDCAWKITSIARENRVARRLLEGRVAGLPVYRPVGRLMTLAISRRQGRRGQDWHRPRPEELEELLDFHHRHARLIQFAPVLDRDLVNRIGLENFRIWRSRGRIGACCAYWNQQSIRQLVGRYYAPWVHWLRPFYNLLARLLGWVCIPPLGQQLDQTFLAFLNLASEAPQLSLLSQLVGHCPTSVAVVGLEPGHPLARRATFQLHTQIYTVDARQDLAPGPVRPEAALL